MIESVNIPQQTQFNVLVIGDACVDTYVYGTVDRISPEAPVPVFVPKREVVLDGMAGNVAKNLEALGCNVSFLHGKSSQKQRLIDERSKQQLLRIDIDAISDPIVFDTDIPGVYNAIVVSDYNKGTIDYTLVEELIKTGIPVFVDTKMTDLERFQGAWVKINELEYSKIKSECSGLIVTRGAKGASVIHHDIECSALKVEVSDVTGAGDTFLAALTVGYLNSKDIETAVKFAIRASAVTVQHVGVYAPRLEEIK
jgi:D-beta-D-heptose 7-phosphate kinase/D-beta-D-heptose 1-phosphate adenosyltransferase